MRSDRGWVRRLFAGASLPTADRGRRARLGVEGLEDRAVPALSTAYTLSGNVGAEVTAFASASLTGAASGTLALSRVPDGASIEYAAVYAVEYHDTGPASLTFAGTPVGQSTTTADRTLRVHKWDVTDQVTGRGTYQASVLGTEQLYGVALAVAFSHPNLPSGAVLINDGAGDLSTNFIGPDSESTTFSVPTEDDYDLWIYTGADNTTTHGPTQSGERILLNGTQVGGPIDSNLGHAASLIRAEGLPAIAGTNTVTVTSNDDWIGWGLAVLAPTVPLRQVSIRPQTPAVWEPDPAENTSQTLSLDFEVYRDGDGLWVDPLVVEYIARLPSTGQVIQQGTATIPANQGSVSITVGVPPSAGGARSRVVDVGLLPVEHTGVLTGSGGHATVAIYAAPYPSGSLGSPPTVLVEVPWATPTVTAPGGPFVVTGYLTRAAGPIDGQLTVRYQASVFEGPDRDIEVGLVTFPVTFAPGADRAAVSIRVPAATTLSPNGRAVRLRVQPQSFPNPSYRPDFERAEGWWFVNAPPQPQPQPPAAAAWGRLTWDIWDNNIIPVLYREAYHNNAARGEVFEHIVAESLASDQAAPAGQPNNGLWRNRAGQAGGTPPLNIFRGRELSVPPPGEWRDDPDIPAGSRPAPEPPADRYNVKPDLVGEVSVRIKTRRLRFGEPPPQPEAVKVDNLVWVEAKSGKDPAELSLTKNGSQMIRAFQALGTRWFAELTTKAVAKDILQRAGQAIPGSMLYVTMPSLDAQGRLVDKRPDEQAVRYAAKKNVVVHHAYMEYAYVNGRNAADGVWFRVGPATNETARYNNTDGFGNQTVPDQGNANLFGAVTNAASGGTAGRPAPDGVRNPTPQYAPFRNTPGRAVLRN